MGKQLGDAADPLLVSVRSGAPFSMPGMMDTVLNLGLNDESVQGPRASRRGNERFAYDSYRRFVQMFGKIVLDVPGDDVRGGAARPRRAKGVAVDTELSAEDLAGLVETFKAIVRERRGRRVPRRPARAARLRDRSRVQVVERPAGRATTAGWRGIPDDLGTAVNVQTMVFGNKGDDSGTGVAFTRNPSTGENKPYGDFLTNAQGEDVVAGIRITEPLDAMGNEFPELPQAAARRDAAAREPLPRHVRHRVHDRAGPPVHAADARRQAHGRGRAAHGGRDGGRGPHRQARGGAARAARAARPAAAPAVRPEGEVRRCSPRASTRRRARRSARCTSPPTTPRRATRRASA